MPRWLKDEFYVCYACDSHKSRIWYLNRPTNLVLCHNCYCGGRYNYRDPNPKLIPCACGCGLYRPNMDAKGRERRYIKGHLLTRPWLTKYLRPQDISSELASCLDLNSQSIVAHNLRIKRTCVGCGNEQVLPVSNFRYGYNGARCRDCVVRPKREASSSWKGGSWIDKGGYRRVRVKSRYVLQHRLIMEKIIGRALKPWETVHHRNGDRDDNRPANLELWTSDHGSGVRISDIRHCWGCRCKRKMRAIPTITLDFFMTTVSTGTTPATIA